MSTTSGSKVSATRFHSRTQAAVRLPGEASVQDLDNVAAAVARARGAIQLLPDQAGEYGILVRHAAAVSEGIAENQDAPDSDGLGPVVAIAEPDCVAPIRHRRFAQLLADETVVPGLTVGQPQPCFEGEQCEHQTKTDAADSPQPRPQHRAAR